MTSLNIEKFKLPLAYAELLSRLRDEGKGSGALDQFSRVLVGPTKTVLPGDSGMWLKLCSWGCIMGREDRLGEIEITPLGETLLAEAKL